MVPLISLPDYFMGNLVNILQECVQVGHCAVLNMKKKIHTVL